MGEMINEYELLAPFQNRDAGFARWTFGRKKGKEYFLKEFLSPVYPNQASLSEKLRTIRIEECTDFQNSKRLLYEAINHASDGNLVRIEEFFRYDSHYYVVMERIEADPITMQEMQEEALEKRILLCASVAHAVMRLHEAHIVHSDLKESNVLLKRTFTGMLVGKVIDFDCSFFEENQPQSEDDLGGDQVYLSPEACRFLCGEEVEITGKADVFALGLLFHKYLTGELPEYDHNEYDYAYDAVLDDQELQLSQKLPFRYRSMLEGMLRKDPEERHTMAEVFDILTNVKKPAPAPLPVTVTDENDFMTGKWFHVGGDL